MAWWRRKQEGELAEPQVQPRVRRTFRRMLAFGLLVAAVACAPQVAVFTRLRERPLEAIVARLDGTVATQARTMRPLTSISQAPQLPPRQAVGITTAA